MQRHKLKVHNLDEWPDHPVLTQRLPVCALEFVFGGGAFHNSHGGEEAEEIGGCEECLIESDARGDLEVFVGEDNAVLEEFEPGCCGWAEDCWGNVSVIEGGES